MYEQVERLVELQLSNDVILCTVRRPFFSHCPGLRLVTGKHFRFNDGFLLATDKFPKTILGYIEKNNKLESGENQILPPCNFAPLPLCHPATLYATITTR